MTYLAEYYDIEHVTGPLFGMEIEVECMYFGDVDRVNKRWRLTEDGSLRNDGAELVSPKPRSLGDMMLDIDAYCHYVSEAPAGTMEHNDRTSVHLHINVSDLEPAQLAACILRALSIEVCLFDTFGSERMANNYCVPYVWCQDRLREVIHACEVMLATNDFYNIEGCKYTSINLRTLAEYGTIELRMAAGTNDRATLRKYVTAAYYIRSAANCIDHAEYGHTLQCLVRLGVIPGDVALVWRNLCAVEVVRNIVYVARHIAARGGRQARLMDALFEDPQVVEDVDDIFI